MRKRNNLEPRMEACSAIWLRDAKALRGKWRTLMPEAREIRVEVGCGKGKFTVETAAAEPDVLLIAVERVQEAMLLGMERALEMGLKNVYFLSLDAAEIEEYFADGEIDLLYLNFCDPWPRKKNAKRRLTYRTFLRKYQRILRRDGEIHFKTDNAALFEWSLGEFEACGLEIRNLTRDLHRDGPVGIMTGYEEKFYELGTPINRCELINREVNMQRIQMTTPLVEMDGDEMTRVLWKQIKDELLLPFIDLKTEYYDLGLPERDRTADQITVDAANAIKKYGVGVKCATITPNVQRMSEYNLHEMWKSPNGTIRAILDGTVFRAPILVEGIRPAVKNWKKPITIARHAYGDVYKATELRVPEGKAELVFTDREGNETRKPIYDFECGGVLTGQYNKDSSISSFARACFNYALATKQDLWFSSKDTIAKIYDGTFKKIFADIYEVEYKERFEQAGITYFYTLIDDAVARVIRSEGGFIWACKNYDGDVMSDMVSTAFGSLAMMTSVLVSPDGKYEYEAAHGTVTKHYYRYLEGEKTSTNPMATIFAWTGALKKRGELDGLDDLTAFAEKLEKVCIFVIERGTMTKDLAALWEGKTPNVVTSEGFIAAIRRELENR
ncbi:MAG: NADP-dependent isocitrate dehydrogenase [Oscillospiraceae bacterium]|nr:NADP-dependent isocitrate dehydrogenase [Oscillospiraceae bacterium]